MFIEQVASLVLENEVILGLLSAFIVLKHYCVAICEFLVASDRCDGYQWRYQYSGLRGILTSKVLLVASLLRARVFCL